MLVSIAALLLRYPMLRLLNHVPAHVTLFIFIELLVSVHHHAWQVGRDMEYTEPVYGARSRG
jgi:hypothetical protein